MAVNGIEIALGQKWVMRDGTPCTVVGEKPGLLYPWIIEWRVPTATDGVLRTRVSGTGCQDDNVQTVRDLVDWLEDVVSVEREDTNQRKVDRRHNHYFKDVSGLQYIDVYRTLALFSVTDPCIQHAVKKLLVAGGRGAGKDIKKDVQEAIDSMVRWQEMQVENVGGAA